MVTLKRDGWHSRLQEWVFGYIPYKNNFCPFFWLTIFCIIATPFVGLYKLVKGIPWAFATIIALVTFIVGKPLELLFNLLDRYLCQPVYRQQTIGYADSMNDESAYDLYQTIFGRE